MSEEQEAYSKLVDALKDLATAIDDYVVAAPEEKASWVLGWQERIEQDFLEFALEIGSVDETD